MKYFAYGMNTNSFEMAYRCPRAISLGSAVLPDHKFRFARHADVLDDPGNQVHGVLWEITDQCLASLDMLEGYPSYYQRKQVRVIDQSGQTVEAMVYYMTGDRPDDLPSESYLLMLYEGYAQHSVPALQIVQAQDYIHSLNTTVGPQGSYYYDYQ